jgi:hypothetical protein
MQLEADTAGNRGLVNDFIRAGKDYTETTNIRYRIARKRHRPGRDIPDKHQRHHHRPQGDHLDG